MTKHVTEISATSGGREVTIARVFDAPRIKLWHTYTDPDLVMRWLGPRQLTGKINTWNVTPGGTWDFTHTDEDGTVYSFHGFLSSGGRAGAVGANV